MEVVTPNNKVVAMKKANGGVAAWVKHTRKFIGRAVNKGERRKAKARCSCCNRLIQKVETLDTEDDWGDFD